jgi:acyl-coenzyme A thioesterase PaaI-like protein
MRFLKKSERRMELVRVLSEDPFATDDQLAARFHVSIATIRLDRQAMNIPEARERIRRVAANRRDDVRALLQREVIGELVDLQLNRMAASELRVDAEHVFSRTGIIRGHYLFAQVNSLATAVMDADVALTARTDLRFYRPVKLGEVLRARVDVVSEHFGVTKCRTSVKSAGETVLDGVILVVMDPQSVTYGERTGREQRS